MLLSAYYNKKMNDFKEIIKKRFSCRSFSNKIISRELIEKIIIDAQSTASWCNSQPWKVHLVSGKKLSELKSKLLKLAEQDKFDGSDIPYPERYEGLYKQRRYDCGMQLYESLNIKKEDYNARKKQSLENFKFFNAPYVAFITSEKLLGTYGVLDCGAFITNFMNFCTYYGVNSIAQAALASFSKTIKTFLDIDAKRSLVCCISFGIGVLNDSVNNFRTERGTIDEVLEWLD